MTAHERSVDRARPQRRRHTPTGGIIYGTWRSGSTDPSYDICTYQLFVWSVHCVHVYYPYCSTIVDTVLSTFKCTLTLSLSIALDCSIPRHAHGNARVCAKFPSLWPVCSTVASANMIWLAISNMDWTKLPATGVICGCLVRRSLMYPSMVFHAHPVHRAHL